MKRAESLVAISGADGNPLAPLRAAARQHSRSALRLHAAAEAVRLRTAPAVGLKRALRHRNETPDWFRLGLRRSARRHRGSLGKRSSHTTQPRNRSQHAFSQQKSSISHRLHTSKSVATPALFTAAGANFLGYFFSCATPSHFPLCCATIGNVHLRFFRRPPAVGRTRPRIPLAISAESIQATTELAPEFALFPHRRVSLGHFVFSAFGPLPGSGVA